MKRLLPMTLPLLAAAALPAAAAAAPPWSAPTPAGSAAPLTPPRVTYLPDGKALITWVSFKDRVRSHLVVRSADGTLSPQKDLAGEIVDVAPATNDALVLRVHARGKKKLTVTRITGQPVIGREETVADARHIQEPRVAVDSSGRAVIAWSRSGLLDGRTRTVRGRLSKTFRLASTDAIEGLSLDARDGRWAASWGQRVKRSFKVRAVRARFGATRERILTAGGHFGRAHTSVALHDRGRLHVLWDAQDHGEQASHPLVVSLATLPADAKRFEPAQVLDRATVPEPAFTRPRLVTAADGLVTAAYLVPTPNAGYGSNQTLRVATADTLGEWSKPQTLATHAALGTLAAGPDDGHWIAWASYAGGTDVRIMAAHRPPLTAEYGPAEEVGDTATTSQAPPSLAVDPNTRRPVVAWAGFDTTARTGAVRVRVSTR